MKFKGEQSSEMTEVFSHVSSEAQLPLANPQGIITSPAKAALPERKLLPVTSVFHPLGMSSGVLPKEGPQMGSDRCREQLTTPLPFHAQPGCVSSPHCFFQPMGNLNHQPHVWLAKWGSPSAPGCRGAGEGAGSQAVLPGT